MCYFIIDLCDCIYLVDIILMGQTVWTALCIFPVVETSFNRIRMIHTYTFGKIRPTYHHPNGTTHKSSPSSAYSADTLAQRVRAACTCSRSRADFCNRLSNDWNSRNGSTGSDSRAVVAATRTAYRLQGTPCCHSMPDPPDPCA